MSMNNYYPNYYGGNYGYMNQYQQPYNTIQPNTQMNNTISNPIIPTGLQGKIVENEEVVKVTDVTMGGYGFFPKADMSEIYVKSWNSNGTTSITTFRPIEKENVPTQEDINKALLEKMSNLEQKIDAILVPKAAAATHEEPKSASQNANIRKEF